MARRRGLKSKSEKKVDDPRDEYLSLFVMDEKDEVKGETIGVEGDFIIIKKELEFFRVPLSSIRLEGKIVRIIKDVNWRSSREQGEKWRAKELDPL